MLRSSGAGSSAAADTSIDDAGGGVSDALYRPTPGSSNCLARSSPALNGPTIGGGLQLAISLRPPSRRARRVACGTRPGGGLAVAASARRTPWAAAARSTYAYRPPDRRRGRRWRSASWTASTRPGCQAVARAADSRSSTKRRSRAGKGDRSASRRPRRRARRGGRGNQGGPVPSHPDERQRRHGTEAEPVAVAARNGRPHPGEGVRFPAQPARAVDSQVCRDLGRIGPANPATERRGTPNPLQTRGR